MLSPLKVRSRFQQLRQTPNPFRHTIDKQLDPTTPLADVNVEPFLIDEQLADLAHETPPRPFVND